VTWRDYHVLPHCCQPSPLKRSICRVKWDTLSQFDDEDQNAIPLLHTQLAETGYATLEVLGIIPYPISRNRLCHLTNIRQY